VPRWLTAIGTVVAAFAGLWAVPLAGPQLPLLALSTAIAVAVGAEAHARLHPRFGPRGGRRLAGYGLGPALAALAAALAGGRLDGSFALAAPVVGALLIAVLLFAQDRELDDHREDRWTPLAYALILYLVAFVLFVVIYSVRDPILLTNISAAICAALLAAALYRPSGSRLDRTWLYAGLTGLCIGELTMALGSWIAVGLLGGAFLLLFFYVAAGLIHSLLDGSLTGRLVMEYSFVGLVGLALILSTSPWRP
jgi:hypothetical protein